MITNKTPSFVPHQREPLHKSLSYLEEDEAPDNVVLNLVVKKNPSEKWGIVFVGGAGSISANVYVKQIHPGTVCDGQLKEGDQILEVVPLLKLF